MRSNHQATAKKKQYMVFYSDLMLTVCLRSIQLNSFTAIYGHACMSLSQNIALFTKPAGKNKLWPRVTTLWCRQLSEELSRILMNSWDLLCSRESLGIISHWLVEVIAQKRSDLQQVWHENFGDLPSDHLMEIIGVVPSGLKIRKDSVWWNVYSTTVSIVSSSLFAFVKILPSAQVEFFNQLI